MKRFCKGFFLFLILSVCSIQTAAAASVHINLDGKPLSTDTAPYIENGRVLVPIRGVLESLGYSVQWEKSSSTVIAAKNDITISLPLNSNTVTVNNEQKTIDVPARLNGSRTFVPLRFLAEYSGANVQWDAASSTVMIRSVAAEEVREYQKEDSIVFIETDKARGSGIILSEDGLIVTNYHLINNASIMQITFNHNEVYRGAVTIVGLAPQQDIALLKIQKNDLKPAAVSTNYAVGDAVTAIGSPGGNRNQVSTGVITGSDQDVICTTAVISGGSSGGGLFNTNNEVIGMTSYHSEEQYFSIPFNLIRQVPQNLSIPLEKIRYYTYEPTAPKNMRYVEKDGFYFVSWSPVCEADHYYVYYSDSLYGTYKKMRNTHLDSDIWHWGFPEAFGISSYSGNPYYIRVSASVNGKETPLSAPLLID